MRPGRVLSAVVLGSAIASCVSLDGVSSGPTLPPGQDDGGAAIEGGTAVDAGPTPDAAAPACPSDAIFCDDFESTLVGWTRKDEERGATAEVVTTRAHGGTHSLRAFGPYDADAGTSNQNQAYLDRALPKLSAGTLGVRAYVYIKGPKQTGHYCLASLSGPTDAQACTYSAALVTVDNGNLWSNVYAGSAVATSAGGLDAVPLDRWFCAEWVYTRGATDHVAFYIDDQPVIDKDTTLFGTGPSCSYETFQLGLCGHWTDGDVEIFYDDLVAAPRRVGCK